MTLKGLMTIRRGSRVYRYLRVKGKLTSLPDLPLDHPDFLAAYAAARKAATPPAEKGTLAAACIRSMSGARWRALSEAYKGTLRRHIEAIREEYGTAKVAALRPQYLRADVDRVTDQLARVKAWRWIFADHDDNPAALLKAPRRKSSSGNTPWTADDVARFRARWPLGTSARAAMELIYWTGARIGDVVRLGPGMVGKDGVLAYSQNKTGSPAFVPWSAPLPAYCAHLSGDRAMMLEAIEPWAGEMVFFPAHGRQRSAAGLGNLVAKAAKAADLDLSAHGLRHARATALAEAGATEHQIAAWTGHESLVLVAHYTRSANRRRAVTGTHPEQETANTKPESANTRVTR